MSPLIKERPFEPQKLEEERNNRRDRVLLDVTSEERRMITKLKALFNTDQDTKVIKICFEWGVNGIQSRLSEKTWKYLTSKTRKRKWDSV